MRWRQRFTALVAVSLLLLLTCRENIESHVLVSQPFNRKKVLAFSLYGTAERYSRGAYQNAQLIRWVYPGWFMRIYHDDSVEKDLLDQLQFIPEVELVNATVFRLNPMNWRFLPAVDDSVEVFCSRDIDARLTLREYSAVSEWLQSGFQAHMIRDHPGHRSHDMLGGMWCAKFGTIPNLLGLLAAYPNGTHFNADQEFLKDMVWPHIRTRTLQHASFGCELWPDTRPIPMPRVGFEHIGAVFVDGQIRAEDASQLLEAIARGEECV